MNTRVIPLSSEEIGHIRCLLRCEKDTLSPRILEKLDDFQPLFAFLELSIAHVSNETLQWIDDRAQEVEDGKAAHLISRAGDDCWFVYCYEENGSGSIPADLFECMQKGRDLGAERLLFNATMIPDDKLDLPIFEKELN